MGTAYTPGLTVSAGTLVRKPRRLPLKGSVTVAVGDRGESDQGGEELDHGDEVQAVVMEDGGDQSGVLGPYEVMIALRYFCARDVAASPTPGEVAFEGLQLAVGQARAPATAGGMEQVGVGEVGVAGDTVINHPVFDEGPIEGLAVERYQEPQIGEEGCELAQESGFLRVVAGEVLGDD